MIAIASNIVGVDLAKNVFQAYWVELKTGEIRNVPLKRGHQIAFVQLTKVGRAGMPAEWPAGAAPRLCAAIKPLTRLPCARA